MGTPRASFPTSFQRLGLTNPRALQARVRPFNSNPSHNFRLAVVAHTNTMARPRRRSPASQRGRREFQLFDRNTSLGWRVTRRIGHAQGEKLVDSNYARRVNDCNGEHIGYQLLDPNTIVNEGLPSVLSPVVLTAREMDLIAGQSFEHGRSRTARMSEVQRITRVHPFTRKILPPEDEVERAAAKLMAFTPRHLQALR